MSTDTDRDTNSRCVNSPGYHLACTLSGHSADVRAVAAFSKDLLVTGSRDGYVRLWQSGELLESPIPVHCPYYVQTLAVLDSAKLLTGSSDKTVTWLDVHTQKVLCIGKGHDDVVSALSAEPASGLVASGSWDRTVRLWKHGQSLQTLEGHQASVWALLFLSETKLLSASADRTIRLWDIRTGQCEQSLQGHSDAVRALALIHTSARPAECFASAGNDGSILAWSASGQLLHRWLDVHSSFIYSLAVHEHHLISAGEDRTLRILDLREGCVVETIPHPNTVWSVATIPGTDGDLLTGCADSCARVWTSCPERMASAEQVAEYEALLANQQNKWGQKEQIDPSQVPDAAVGLAEPGSRDGQTRLVRRQGSSDAIEVYMWSMANARWLKIGDVTDPPAKSSRSNKTGYDLVFDVDVDGDAQRYRQLGYRRGENPYLAAERFLEEENLPRAFLEQIVQFLIDHVPANDLGMEKEAPSDPLTGSDRYVPLPDLTSLESNQRGRLPEFVRFESTDSYERILEHLPAAGRTRSLFSSLEPVTTEKLQVLAELLDTLPTAQVVAVIDLARLAVLDASAVHVFFANEPQTALDAVMRHAASPDASFGVQVSACRFLCNSFVHWQSAPVRRALLQRSGFILDTFTAQVNGHTPAKLWRVFTALLYNYAVLEKRCDVEKQSIQLCSESVLQSACLLGLARPAGVDDATELVSALCLLIHNPSRAKLAIAAGILEWEQIPSKIVERIRAFA
ncbi:hypothetical protein CCYA_CCYA12G3400 [Cyanidiococcus yangmingshanensis]|nr:hypothetical protein CCYA_CCYA12G3400 [Cyanidiococcus yangmingshanensis]